jgi:hypothetical protein
MSISSAPINVAQLQQVVTQLNYLSNQISKGKHVGCKEIELLTRKATNEVNDLIDAIQQQISDLGPWQALLSLPGADPGAIVSWLGKLVSTIIGPQIKAYMSYVLAVSLLASLLPKILQAVAQLGPALEQCAINSATSGLTTLQQYAAQDINALVGPALSNINTLQNALQNINGSHFNITLDTSSAQNFVTSINSSGPEFFNNLSTYSSTPIVKTAVVGTLTSGNNTITNLPANLSSITVGSLITSDVAGSLPANTTVASITTISTSFNANITQFSSILTQVYPTTGLKVGQTLSSPTTSGFDANSVITSIASGTIVMSIPYLGSSVVGALFSASSNTIVMSANALSSTQANLSFSILH